MKKFDKDKDKKFSKQEVKNILDKTCWWSVSNRSYSDNDISIIYNEINWEFTALTNVCFSQVFFFIVLVFFLLTTLDYNT